MINDFMDAYSLDDVVVVADAGMISTADKQALERAGLSYVLGSRTPARPPPDQLLARQPPRPGRPRRPTLTQPWPAGPRDQRRDETIYYRYSADRARRTLRGIDTQVAKAEKADAGKIPVKRNRFVHLSSATRSVNRDLGVLAPASPTVGMSLDSTPTVRGNPLLFTMKVSFPWNFRISATRIIPGETTPSPRFPHPNDENSRL